MISSAVRATAVAVTLAGLTAVTAATAASALVTPAIGCSLSAQWRSRADGGVRALFEYGFL